MALLLHLSPRYIRRPYFHFESLADVPIAHLLYSFRWRRLPLGLRDPRPPLRPRPRLLHRLPQFLWLDIRPRLYRLHPLQCSRTNVRSFPPRPHHQTMARLCRFHSNHLVLLRACGIWKSFIASVEPNRVVSGDCWWTCDHHRSRSHAESTCQQLGCMGRLQPEQRCRLEQWCYLLDWRAQWCLYNWHARCSNPHVGGVAESSPRHASGCGSTDHLGHTKYVPTKLIAMYRSNGS